MSDLGPVLAVLGAAPERLWGAMMKRVADGLGMSWAHVLRVKKWKKDYLPVLFHG